MDMKDMTGTLPPNTQTSGLSAVMNTLVDAAIVIDSAGDIQLINPAGEAIFEYRADELLGRNVTTLMPNPYRSEHDGYIQRHIETGEARIIGIGREVEGRRKSGEVFPMHLAVGEMGRNGSTLFVGIIRDLTEDRRRAAEFEALQARHFHLSRVTAMNEMGATIAHEINQPLAATANYIETARILADREEVGDPRLPEMLARALEQNDRAARIITRMRSFIERGDVSMERVDLAEVVEDALLLALTQSVREETDLQVAVAPEARFVRGDPVQIQQVLVNLVRNAADAMQSGPRRALGLDVSVDREDAALARLEVTDTGSGLSEDMLPELFSAFVSDKPGGLGVGLSISRSIVQAHGGRIWASQRPEGGARFSVTLPRDLPA
ncbi:MAG: PAS domain S-box protein [Litorimonas sp.]